MTKNTSDHTTIKLRNEVYRMIEELRTQFADMTNNPDLTDEDVIAVLINGFIESVEQSHHGKDGECCRGGSCDDHQEWGCGCH